MNPKKRARMYTDDHPRIGIWPTCSKKLGWLMLAATFLVSGGSARSQEKPSTPPSSEPIVDSRILQAKRVCIDNFGDDALGRQVKEMVIARLFEARRYSLSEVCSKADLILRGSVSERTEHVVRSESEGVSAGKQAVGVGASSTSVVAVGEGGTLSAHESLSSSQTKEHAVVTLRVVDSKDGDILWAISLESDGGKTKGAIGDAAERAVRRLLRDIERAEKSAQKR